MRMLDEKERRNELFESFGQNRIWNERLHARLDQNNPFLQFMLSSYQVLYCRNASIFKAHLNSICEKVASENMKIDNSSSFANQPDIDYLCYFKRAEWYMWNESQLNADNDRKRLISQCVWAAKPLLKR